MIEMATTVVLFGPMPGGIEMAVILLIVVLLFGANKLPKLARSSGQALGEFKKGREQIEEELQDMRGDSVSGSGSTETQEPGQFSQDQNEPTQEPSGGSENSADEWGSSTER